MLSTVKHYATKLMLMLYGPPQLDERNDPMKIEDRKYEAEHEIEHEHRSHGKRKGA